MASLSYDDTLPVPKLPGPGRQARPLTTQFAPERPTNWPWAVALVVWLFALATPIDPVWSFQLQATAQQLLDSSR